MQYGIVGLEGLIGDDSMCKRPTVMILTLAAVLVSSWPATADAAGWYRQFTITADDAAPLAEFGYSVALDGSMAIIGAQLDGRNFSGSGSAYLLDVTTGTQLAKFRPTPISSGGWFGHSVDIYGGTAIIGAYKESPQQYHQAGSAYLFDVSTGDLLSKFWADEPAAWQWFGESVAIGSTTAVVGAPGTDEVYMFDARTGTQLGKLTSPEGGTGSSDAFGAAIAVHGDIAVIGAPNYSGPEGTWVGAAYLFDLSTGVQLGTLMADDYTGSDRFGASVDINGSLAIVGAPNHDIGGFGNGAAYVFDISSGEQLAKLTADDPGVNRGFGGSVAVSDTLALLGAPLSFEGTRAGAAYLFDVDTGSQLAKFVGDDPMEQDHLGLSVAISEDAAIFGSPQNSDAGYQAGSVCVLVPEPSSLVMLAAAVAALLVRRRRRR